jgi:hypothetical protein
MALDGGAGCTYPNPINSNFETDGDRSHALGGELCRTLKYVAVGLW